MAVSYPTALRDDRLGLVVTRAGGGALIRVYSGSRPASANDAATGTLLGTKTGGSPFGTVTGGVLTGSAVTGSTAVASGTASWFRVTASNGTTTVFDGDVGATGSGAEMILADVQIVEGGTLEVDSITITGGNA
jgi:hypothetical protein